MADLLKKRNVMMIYTLLLLLFAVASHLKISIGAGVLSVDDDDGGELMEMEIEMESETSRRVLWGTAGVQKRYISYGALKGDFVPCTRPGAPYYNCRALPKANPYTRGCEIITGCARDMNP